MLGPVVLAMALMLGLLQSWRAAWWLARAWLIAAVSVGAIKLLLLACGQHWQPGLESPSGHACMAVVAYGSIAWIAGSGRSAQVRLLLGIVAFFAILAIAISRVMVGAHTVIEVLVGLEVGALALLSFAVPYLAAPARSLDLRICGALLAATAVAASGLHINAEGFLRHAARRLGESCHASASDRSAIPAPAARRFASLPNPRSDRA
jgi:hypothetical protein